MNDTRKRWWLIPEIERRAILASIEIVALREYRGNRKHPVKPRRRASEIRQRLRITSRYLWLAYAFARNKPYSAVERCLRRVGAPLPESIQLAYYGQRMVSLYHEGLIEEITAWLKT